MIYKVKCTRSFLLPLAVGEKDSQGRDVDGFMHPPKMKSEAVKSISGKYPAFKVCWGNLKMEMCFAMENCLIEKTLNVKECFAIGFRNGDVSLHLI